MIPYIKDYLLSNWERLKLGEKPENIEFIKSEDRMIRDPEVGIITFLAKSITSSGEKPLLIIRIPRYPKNQEANLSLQHEYEKLSKLHEKLSKTSFEAVIPKPIIWEIINSTRVLAINFLTGGPLSHNIISGNLIKTFIENSNLALSWLIQLQKQYESKLSKNIKTIVEEELEGYIKLFPDNVAANKVYFKKLLDMSEAVKDVIVPIYLMHGDFHAENIFLLENKVSGVIDWEDFEENGLPGFDLFHFIRTYFEALLGYFSSRGDIDSITTLSENPQINNLVKTAVNNYLQQLGIDPKLSDLLLPLYFIRSAVMAGSPRKNAKGALKRIETLIQLRPYTIDDVLLYLSVFNYGEIYNKAKSDNNSILADLCLKKLDELKKKIGSNK